MKVTIDGQSIEVEPGPPQSCRLPRMIGGESVPPTMCYYSKIERFWRKMPCLFGGALKGSDANPTPMPKLMASCVTGVMDGMEAEQHQIETCYRSKKIGYRIFAH